MRFHVPVLATALLLGGAAAEGLAFDLPVFEDNFDSYDQASFVAAWPRFSGTIESDATLTTTQAETAPNSVSFPPPGATVNNQQRHRRSIAAEDFFVGEKYVFSFDIRESGFIGSPQRMYMSLHSGAANLSNQLIQIGMNNNQNSGDSGGNFYMARILGFTPCTTAGCDPDGGPPETTAAASSFFKLNDFGNAGLRTPGNTWRNLKVEISFGGTRGAGVHYDFFVDDVLAERVSNVGSTHRIYDSISLGSGLGHATNTVFIDNVKAGIFFVPEEAPGDINGDGLINALDYVVGRVGDEDLTDWSANYTGALSGSGSAQAAASAVPEPAALALMVLGLAAAGFRRRGR